MKEKSNKIKTKITAFVTLFILLMTAFPGKMLASVQPFTLTSGNYIMIDLDTGGPCVQHFARKINESGDIVGSCYPADWSYSHAFLYRNGQMIDLGTLGGPLSEATAINKNGDVIGYSLTTPGWSNQIRRGFLYRNGQMIVLSLGGTQSEALAINENGDVIGWSATVNNETHAFLYRNGQMIDLGTLGGSYSRATAINENGDIVGFSYTTGNQASHAFLYRNNQMIDLGTLGGAHSSAAAINENGDIVGSSQLAGNQISHAFLYRNGQMIDLGTLGHHSYATAINENGDIIGSSIKLNSSGGDHAFLYRNNQMIDLYPSSSQSWATEINENGDVIGNSLYMDINGNQTTRAFLNRNSVTIPLSFGGINSFASDINENGDVVGAAQPVGDPAYHAFFYRNDQMVDLGTLGGTQSEALAINNKGDIVGYSQTLGDKVYHAFIVKSKINNSPTVTSLNGPIAPISVNTPAQISVNYSDDDPADTHTVTFSWGDGTQDSTVEKVAGATGATEHHIYINAGVYLVEVTVRDDKGATISAQYEYVVVYDPSAGFVTGGGWIMSPAGACPANPSLTGKATFGFVSKYQKGANKPTGNTEFQFNAADFRFKSDLYDWLVVAGAKAQFKGTGSVNGILGYSFMLTATDGQINGGGGTDKFRIKIWNTASGVIVYDNVLGGSDKLDEANPQAIGGGSIVIHSGK